MNPTSFSNEQCERMLLACVLAKQDLLPAIDERLFHDARAIDCLNAMRRLKSDRVEVTEERMMRAVDQPAFAFLNEGCNELPSPAGWEYWFNLCGEYADEREKSQLAKELMWPGADVAAIGSRLRELAGGQRAAGGQTMRDIAPSYIDELESAFKSGGRLRGFRTGFPGLDRCIRGLQACRLYVVAGRPGAGKSALALNIAANVAADGHRVAFFSLEMPNVEVAGRVIHSSAQVGSGVFESGRATESDFGRVMNAVNRTAKAPIEFFDNVSALRDIARITTEAVRRRGVELVVVDYLQRIRVPGSKDGRVQIVTEISSTLKDLAMTLRVPMIAAAQLNRAVEKENRKPMLSDLRESGSIEQDADVVAFLYSEESRSEKCELSIAKNRSGDTWVIDLKFNREITRFDPWPV